MCGCKVGKVWPKIQKSSRRTNPSPRHALLMCSPAVVGEWNSAGQYTGRLLLCSPANAQNCYQFSMVCGMVLICRKKLDADSLIRIIRTIPMCAFCTAVLQNLSPFFRLHFARVNHQRNVRRLRNALVDFTAVAMANIILHHPASSFVAWYISCSSHRTSKRSQGANGTRCPSQTRDYDHHPDSQ